MKPPKPSRSAPSRRVEHAGRKSDQPVRLSREGNRQATSREGNQRTISPSRPYAPSVAHVALQPERGDLIYGFRASEAVLSKRGQSVHEVLVDFSQFEPAWRHSFDVLRRTLSAHVRITETPSASLQRLTESTNHEGIAVRAAARSWVPAKDLKRLLVEGQLTAIALDRVRNPYNIGAILRSAAFFGVDVVILGAPAPHPALPPDAVRVAEGGAEHVRLARTTDLAETLAQLRSVGVRVLGAENDGAVDAFAFRFPQPSVLVFGHEREGLSDRVKANCDQMVAIRGTGAIQSLNVAIAASVLIGELTRTR